MVDRENFEISTRGLKAHCSASELPVHKSINLIHLAQALCCLLLNITTFISNVNCFLTHLQEFLICLC